jgi:hypothetical protein
MYQPMYSGPQFGEPELSKYLLETSLEIVKEKEKNNWNFNK